MLFVVEAAQRFTLLPDPADIGLVGSGSAVAGVVIGALAYILREPLEQVALAAAIGAIGGGVCALVVWALGITGVLSLP